MDHRTEPNALILIRSFLRGHGIAPRPWATYREVIDRLYGLLWSRRNDEPFWAQIRELVERLDASHFDLQRWRRTQVIPDATVDQLLIDLRSRLNSLGESTPGAIRWYGALGGSGLLVFLLLGTAVACNDPCDERAAEQGIEDPDVYCDLVYLINDADIPWTVRANLLDCLPQLDAEDRAYYLKQFETAPDEELARLLENLSTNTYHCDRELYPHEDDEGH
jgi:hypothetical protein